MEADVRAAQEDFMNVECYEWIERQIRRLKGVQYFCEENGEGDVRLGYVVVELRDIILFLEEALKDDLALQHGNHGG